LRGAVGNEVIEYLRKVDGILEVHTNAEACKKFGLPPDRVGDIVVISDRNVTLGTSVERHDLSGLTEPLRSHGGVTEQKVPLIMNRAAPALAGDRVLRNFDAFDLAFNYATDETGRAAAE
jgi:phosphonoacetate hydrolase